MPGEYVERALGKHHTGIYGLGEWRELLDEQTGEAYQISSPGCRSLSLDKQARGSVRLFYRPCTGRLQQGRWLFVILRQSVLSRTVSEM